MYIILNINTVTYAILYNELYMIYTYILPYFMDGETKAWQGYFCIQVTSQVNGKDLIPKPLDLAFPSHKKTKP